MGFFQPELTEIINTWQHLDAVFFFSPHSLKNILAFCLSVHSDFGWRQVGPRPEVGRQRDKVRQRNQRWQVGHGKKNRFRLPVLQI